jgi:hypothetical protein
MQESGDIRNLPGRKRWERRHSAIRPPVPNHRTDRVALIIVKDKCRANQIWSALPASIVAMTEAAGGNEYFLASLYRLLIEMRAAH